MGHQKNVTKCRKQRVVAGLLGAGNRLDGTMLSEQDEDRVQIQTAGTVVWCMNLIGKKESGTVAELRFRPEGWKILWGGRSPENPSSGTDVFF